MTDVLHIPGVFDADLCTTLIMAFEDKDMGGGGKLGGVACAQGGDVVKPHIKLRYDWVCFELELGQVIWDIFEHKVAPIVQEAFDVPPQMIERICIGHYPVGGRFAKHQDKGWGTQYRNFEVSLPLSTDFEGGKITFYDSPYVVPKMSVGDALIYRADLWHELEPVTKGERYGFTTFMFNKPGNDFKPYWGKFK